MQINCQYSELVDVHKLVPHKRNANKHPDRQIELLAKNIDFQGWRLPIVVSNRSSFIVAGHGRLEAAKKLGYEKVPVSYQDFESEAQEFEFLISDNKLAELAEHDDSIMIEGIKELEIDDFELLGLDDFEIPIEPDAAKDEIEDDVPTDVETRCKPGDLWLLGEHRLLCGDATDVLCVEKLMNGAKADMVFTDPPYGVSYEQGKFTGKEVKNKFKPIANDEKRGDDLRLFIRDVFINISSVCETASIYAWSPPLLPGAEILAGLIESGWHIQSQLIWDKERLVLGRADYHWQHEICWYGYIGKNHHWCGDRKQTSIWKQKRDTGYEHPTQKPVELSERAINNSSKQDNNVIDVFGGSGSTLIACEKTKRKCYMAEIDPHYCDVILSRWEKYTGKEAKLENRPE